MCTPGFIIAVDYFFLNRVHRILFISRLVSRYWVLFVILTNLENTLINFKIFVFLGETPLILRLKESKKLEKKRNTSIAIALHSVWSTIVLFYPAISKSLIADKKNRTARKTRMKSNLYKKGKMLARKRKNASRLSCQLLSSISRLFHLFTLRVLSRIEVDRIFRQAADITKRGRFLFLTYLRSHLARNLNELCGKQKTMWNFSYL